MNTVTLKSYSEPSYNFSEILRYMSAANDDSTINLINDCISELKNKLTYKVCYLYVSDNCIFERYSSKVLSNYLAGTDGFILLAATIGIEIDKLILKYSHISPTKALAFQAIGAERIEALCDAFQNDIKTQFSHIKPRISPGYGDMPLEMQREVFAILDCPRKIGLTLNCGMSMSPSKSVTAFIGVKK